MRDHHKQARRVLRLEATGARGSLSGVALAAMSAVACARVTALPMFASAERVAVYSPVGCEVDPFGVVDVARRQGKSVYYPRMSADGLDFLEAGPDSLVAGRFGISEPVTGDMLSSHREGTLFVVPGLVFDLRGARLGRGGGWYDRALSHLPAASRVGLAYEFQVVPRLPESPRDVPMHAVVTECRVVEMVCSGLAH